MMPQRITDHQTPGLCAAAARPLVHVVTWFYERQPGLAIYTARLQALMKHADVVVVCRHVRDVERLGLPLKAHVIDTKGESQFDILRYAWRVAKYLNRQTDGTVCLMSSQVAMAAWWLRGRETSLYWNEMPEHIFPRPRWNVFKAFSHAWLRRMTYRGALTADVVMPISHFMQADLLRRGRAAATTPVVPMGVFGHVPDASPAEPTQRPLQLIYAGSLSAERAEQELLEGTLLALKQGVPVQLTLVGLPKAQQGAWKARFENEGFGEHLQLLGLTPHEEVLSMVSQADIAFAMLHPKPHFQFNPPTKVFEYLACGVPVLYNDIRTLSHYLEHGQTGFCAELSAHGVADALRWLSAHRAELQAWRLACREAARPYLWDHVESQFLECSGFSAAIARPSCAEGAQKAS